MPRDTSHHTGPQPAHPRSLHTRAQRASNRGISLRNHSAAGPSMRRSTERRRRRTCTRVQLPRQSIQPRHPTARVTTGGFRRTCTRVHTRATAVRQSIQPWHPTVASNCAGDHCTVVLGGARSATELQVPPSTHVHARATAEAEHPTAAVTREGTNQAEVAPGCTSTIAPVEPSKQQVAASMHARAAAARQSIQPQQWRVKGPPS